MFAGNLESLLAQVQPELQQKLRIELREQQRQDAIETVKCRYDSTRYQQRPNARVSNAELLGLTAIGRGSAFASLVAVHPQFEDMVLKVVPSDDAGALYAKACYDGEIDSVHSVKVYAYHELDGNAFIYMERLIDVNDWPENSEEYLSIVNMYAIAPAMTDSRVEPSIIDWVEKFNKWNEWSDGRVYNSPFSGNTLRMTRFGTDFHNGNVMYRADGTLVFIDPVYGEDAEAEYRYASQKMESPEVSSGIQVKGCNCRACQAMRSVPSLQVDAVRFAINDKTFI